jgi:hypothetical protein
MLENLKTVQKIMQDANPEKLYEFIENGYDTDFKKLGYLYSLCTDFQKKELWRKNVAIAEANNSILDFITLPRRNVETLENRVKMSVNRFFDRMNVVQDFIDAELREMMHYKSVKRAVDYFAKKHVQEYGKKLGRLNFELVEAQKEKEEKLRQILDNPALISSNNGIGMLIRYKQHISDLRSFANNNDIPALFDFSESEKKKLEAYLQAYKQQTGEELTLERPDPFVSVYLKSSRLMRESGLFLDYLPSNLEEELNIERGVVKEMVEIIYAEHEKKRSEAIRKGRHVCDLVDVSYFSDLFARLRAQRPHFITKQKLRRANWNTLFQGDLERIVKGKQKKERASWKQKDKQAYLDVLRDFQNELETGLVAAEKTAERALIYQ